jgi:hypothetical protein
MMENFPKQTRQAGYTIIETMIAISLFLVVVTMGINTLLNANVVHQKSQDIRSEIDNLSYIIDDISRNLRTGYNFHCFSLGDILPVPSASSPKSCSNGWGIAFETSTGSRSDNDDQWVYYIDSSKIFKSTRGPSSLANFIQLTSDEIIIDSVSGFSVLGAESQIGGDTQQPIAIIRLIGKITYKGVVTPFSLETTISQRLLDT